jgi:hypothetical protein
MSKRPSLFRSDDHHASAPVAEATKIAIAVPVNGSKGRPVSRQGKKVLSVFLEPKAWRQLRSMALDEETTTQALGVEAVNLLFAARGRGHLA